jgi:predicted Ser/Thr protein kinase
VGDGSTVFEATDGYRLDLPTTDLRVAIKVLHTVEQQREFQHLQLLSHANIVRVHEFDRDGGIDFFTMEFLSGAPLGKVLTARNGTALPRQQALTIIRDVGAALAYAHSRGVVHGDLSPQHIIITNDGELRVLGFASAHPSLERRRPDVRDDVFAFCCVAYFLMSGRHPFPEHTALEARLRRLRPDRPAGLTGQQWRALRAGLDWEREKRPSDVGQWLDSFGVTGAAPRLPPLSAMMKLPPPRKHHLIRKSAAAALLALLIAAGYWVVTDERAPGHVESGWESEVRAALSGIGAALVRLMPARSPQPSVTPSVTPGVTEPAPVARDVPSAPKTAARVPAPATAGAAPAAPVAGAVSAGPAVPVSSAVPVTRASTPARVAPTPPATAVAAANAGSVHIEMAADTIDIPAGEETAQVIVRRKGSLHGDSHFTWWTESGTAKPGVDFVAVAPHEAEFAEGGSTLSLNVPIANRPHDQPKSFYVMIGPAETGAPLGQRTLTMVTIQPPAR